MNNLDRLIEIFSHFPGIGPRQARRFAYYLLGKPRTFIKDFVKLIQETKSAVSECVRCRRLFMSDDSKSLSADASSESNQICTICSDLARDGSTLMIVARDSDFESIEKSGAYKGLYFILGGLVPVLDKDPEKRIRLRKLLERISSNRPGLKEVILSLSTTADGEHTANIVREAILKLSNRSPITITLLGRGLSTGAELEYVDSDTIRNALKHRT